MDEDILAQEIAHIAADLPASHITAWATVLSSATGPSVAVEAALIDARPGYAVAAHARRLMTAWRAAAAAADLPGSAIALALRSASTVCQNMADRRTELVISGPTSPAVAVRLTSSVVVEVIRAARDSLLIVSFAAYGIAEVLTELAGAAGRGVRIDLVLESGVEDGGALRGFAGASTTFSGLRDRARFWYWPVASRRAAGNSRAALHAKIIAADASVALVGSANLTDRALSANLEVGVLLRDPDVVRRLVQHFAALMRAEAHALKPLV